MKIISIVLVLLVTSPALISGQTKFTFLKGVKVNTAMANYLYQDKRQGRLNAGFAFGTVDRLNIGEHLALQGELLFHHGTNTLPTEASNVKYWRVEVPTYVIWRLPAGGGKILFGAGPYLSLGITAKRDPGNINLYKSSEYAMNRWNSGVSALAGYEWHNGLFIDLTYHLGLTDGWLPWTPKSNNAITKGHRNFNLGIGYRFRLFGVQLDKKISSWLPSNKL